MICGLERHSIGDVHRYLPTDAVVLELGARYGTVSCAISRVQHGSGLRVLIEPDVNTFASLSANLAANNCSGLAVNGAVSELPMFQFWREGSNATGYGNSRVLTKNCSEMPQSPYVFGHRYGRWWCAPIPTYSVASLAERLSDSMGRSVRFTALVVDCEGCWLRFMQENRAFLEDPALEYILYETDEKSASLINMTCALGFGVVENRLDCMTPRAPGLAQVVFKRQPAPGSGPSRLGCNTHWNHCDHACLANCGLYDDPTGAPRLHSA